MPLTFETPFDLLGDSWVVTRHAVDELAQAPARQTPVYEFVPLGEVAEIASGQYVRQYVAVGTPYVRVDNVRRHVMNMSEGDVVHIPTDALAGPTRIRCTCRKGDVLVARTGTLGKATLAIDIHDGFAMSQHISRVRLHGLNLISSGSLCLFLNSPLGTSQLIGKGMGSSRLELSHSALASVRVPVLQEDLHLAFSERLEVILARHFRLVSSLRELIETSDKLMGFEVSERVNDGVNDLPLFAGLGALSPAPVAFSAPREMLEGMWTPRRYVPVIRGSLDALRAEFECVPLGSIAAIRRGKGTRVAHYDRTGIPFLRTSSLVNYGVDPFTDHCASLDTYEQFAQAIHDNDIVFSIEGRIGLVAMLFSKFPVVLKNHLELIRLRAEPRGWDREELCGWVFLVLSGRVGKIQSEMYSVVQSTIAGLAHRLRDFVIPVMRRSGTSQAMKRLGRRASETALALVEAVIDLRTLQEEFDAVLGVTINASLGPRNCEVDDTILGDDTVSS